MDISAYLQSYLVTNDDKVISNIPNFLEIAVSRVNKRMKSAFLELYGYDLILPADFVAMKYLTVNGALYAPNLVQLEGTYTINAGRLTVYPELVSGDILAFVYYAINQSILTQGSPAVLLHGAAAEALMFEGNKEDAAAENLLFNQDLDECLGWESNGTLTLAGSGGGIEGVSVPTPPPPPTLPASAVTFQPSGTISATNVQAALQELDGETQTGLATLDGSKVAKAGDTMTGLLTAGAGFTVSGGNFISRGISDTATSEKMRIAPDGTVTAGGLSTAPAFQVNPVAGQSRWITVTGAAAGSPSIGANAGGLRVTSNLGIGEDPITTLSLYAAASCNLTMRGDAATIIQPQLFSNDANGPSIAFKKARGTSAAQAAVASGDGIGSVTFNVWGGTSLKSGATIEANVLAYVSNTDISTRMVFKTCAAGGALLERFRLEGDKVIQFPGLTALNFANDSLAAAGGVPIGGLYHNAGAVRVRLV